MRLRDQTSSKPPMSSLWVPDYLLVRQKPNYLILDAARGTPEEVHAIESQAIGRAYRMGQDKSIVVVRYSSIACTMYILTHRFVIENTIEHEQYRDIHEKGVTI